MDNSDEQKIKMLAANKAIQREKSRVYTTIILIGIAVILCLSICEFL